jgi:hypothetical protein
MSPPLKRGFIKCSLHRDGKTPDLNIVLKMSTYKLGTEQKGFRKGMRTSDHIFTLKTLIDKYFKKNKYIFACFIDLKKAFDTVNRNALLHKIFQYNIRGNFYFLNTHQVY